ncbi:MAG: hypothetical protein PHD01_00610 [Geobacteraceae bacterium]|nr:hypothetical protein [Geobacteraceae bacterium]
MVCEGGKTKDLFSVLAEDIADWAERFLRAEAAGGKEAAGQVLGGIAEWLGSDLVDGMPVMPLERWLVLDTLAEELLQGCKAHIAEKQADGQTLSKIIRRAREMVRCPQLV